jgi:hypothetical protein
MVIHVSDSMHRSDFNKHTLDQYLAMYGWMRRVYDALGVPQCLEAIW